MSIKDELIGAGIVNQNVDEEAVRIIGALEKLDNIQQAVISGFATLLNKGSVLFLSSGTFVVPDGVTEVAITGCGAGGVIYAGEGCIRQKVTVTAGEQIEVKCGTNMASEFGDYVYLGNATSTENGNSDVLGIGAILGLKGSDGTAGSEYSSNNVYAKGGYGGTGGYGGMLGFGGGGGGGGAAGHPSYSLIDVGKGGTGSGSEISAKIAEQTVSLPAGAKGSDGAKGTTSQRDANNIQTVYGGKGGKGGDGGGFGGGAGSGGKGGKGACPNTMYYKSESGANGSDGTGAAGFILVEWGVDV